MERLSKKAMNKAREAIGITKGKSKKEKKEKEKKDGDDEDMNEDVDSDDKKDKESDMSDSEDVSFEDKVAFTEKVRRLTNEGLTKLVKKVKDLCSEALEDVDSEKLHIQVDKIDKKSFE